MRSLFLTLSAAALFSTAMAQNNFHCGTDRARAEAIARDPSIIEREAQLEQQIRELIANAEVERDGDTVLLTIPIVFHIIYDELAGSPLGNANIPDANIFDQVAILNRDYRKLNVDINQVCCGFQNIAADVHLQFKLATRTPTGECTNGIERIRSIESFVGDDGSKLSPWQQSKYLNVWIVARMRDGVAGYAYYPSAIAGTMVLADGVIILHDYIGSLPPSNPFSSRALTHEIGHYLNLSHTWGSTNDPEVACGDDEVEDTPRTAGHNSCDNPGDLKDYECNTNPLDTVYTFSQVTTSSGTTDPTPPPTAIDSLENYGDGVTFSPFSAHGVSANSAYDDTFAFTEWDGNVPDSDTLVYADISSNPINTNKYYEFTVSPILGRAMSLTSLSFSVKRLWDGPRTYSVRSSINNFATNIGTLQINPGNPDLTTNSGNVFFFAHDDSQVETGSRVNLSGYSYMENPVTFRIYAWNAEAPTGTFEVTNVIVRGTFGVIENTENYMEYSYCSKMYTQGQSDRMRATLSTALASRSNLWAEGNLVSTGTAPGSEQLCGPVADFYPNTHFACAGTPINFEDNSTRATVTSWLWNFQDGTPATSTDENPSVSFSGEGWKSVTLTVGNDQGTSTRTIEHAVRIAPIWGDVPGFLGENFEDAGRYEKWTEVNHEANDSWWERVQGVGYNSNSCVRLDAFDQEGWNDFIIDDFFSGRGAGNDIDELVSPSLNLDFASDMNLTFRTAYATQVSVPDDVTEKLEIYMSNNCGYSWQLRYTIAGTDLVNNGVVGDYFVPTSNDQWAFHTYSVSSQYEQENVRIRFRFTSADGSNNLYIDDINIEGNVGIADHNAPHAEMDVFPNPTTSTFTVNYAMNEMAPASLNIVDASGRVVLNRDLGNVKDGTVTIDTRAMNISSGIYQLFLDSPQGRVVQRLVIQ